MPSRLRSASAGRWSIGGVGLAFYPPDHPLQHAQVVAWNEQRATDRQAEIFTERLRADLRVEAWGYEFFLLGFATLFEATLAEGFSAAFAALSRLFIASICSGE